MRGFRMWFAWDLLSVMLAVAAGCGGGYDLTFKCDPGGPECPRDQECPTVRLGSGGCEDLPGVLGHQPTRVDVGRPVGCTVGLAYGNPYYGGDQVHCVCKVSASQGPDWACPI